MDLVTGASGFLGGHLIKRLLADPGARLRLLCRRPPTPDLGLPIADPRVEVALGDVTQPTSLAPALANIRRVFHIAGHIDFGPTTREQMFAVNVGGVRHLLTAAQAAGVERVVHVSSVSTLGAAVDMDHPLSEADFGRGLGLDLPYPQSKYQGECVALEFARHGLDVVIANPTFIVGPGDRHLGSARTIVSFVRRQLWVGLDRGGLGMTDVRDVAEGVVRVMERGRTGERYILGGENFSLRQYHRLLGELTGQWPSPLRVPPWLAVPLSIAGRALYAAVGIKTYVAPGDIRMGRHYWVYDYTRARTDLDLHPRPARESLADTLEWLAATGVLRRDLVVRR